MILVHVDVEAASMENSHQTSKSPRRTEDVEGGIVEGRTS